MTDIKRDINTYANEQLLDFIDAMHNEIKVLLEGEFEAQWFKLGVEQHLRKNALEPARNMLSSPMRTVDMGKADDELYGVEHLWRIVDGNWTLIFGSRFGDRHRTSVYFGEITELRHNVSHRRPHHMLRRRDLLRFIHNAQRLLAAVESPLSSQFEETATTLEQGRTPWGRELVSALPPANEIVSDFIGREHELDLLSKWISHTRPSPIVIWGYGGSGKSAIAYQFAQAACYAAPSDTQAVVWLSAKRREYIEGQTRDRTADFTSVQTFTDSLYNALYGASPESSLDETTILQELQDTPCLLIVDDFDTVQENTSLANFLLFQLTRTNSKIIFTSRHKIPGLETIEVHGFDGDDLQHFVEKGATKYKLSLDDCLKRLPGIRSVTDGFPLFIDDLLRHASFVGLRPAMEAWNQRKGDAAREYALRRQLESLGDPSRRILIGAAAAKAPLSSLELADVARFTQDDVDSAIDGLLGWHLLTRSENDSSGHPTFACNLNTARLVELVYGKDPAFEFARVAFRNLSGMKMPTAYHQRVARAIGGARYHVMRGDYETAREEIRDAMRGDLENNPDLWGALGWAWSREHTEDSTESARFAFEKAHQFGSRKEDTYHHWCELERDVAERTARQEDNGTRQLTLDQWQVVFQVASSGVDRCGNTPSLCFSAAYAKTREGKALLFSNFFTSAENCFREAVVWARLGLEQQNATSREVDRSRIHKSLVLALEGLGDLKGVEDALDAWRQDVGEKDVRYLMERERF